MNELMFIDLAEFFIFVLQILFGIALVVYSPFCFCSVPKEKSRSDKTLYVVLGFGSLICGLIILVGSAIPIIEMVTERPSVRSPWSIKNIVIPLRSSSLFYGLTSYNNLFSSYLNIFMFIGAVLFLALSIVAFIAGIKHAREEEGARTKIARLKAGNVLSIIAALAALSCVIYMAAGYFTGKFDPNPIQVGKPVVYFYPEEETEVTAMLGKPEALTVSYPEYDAESGWRFTARPDGTLSIGEREYPYMYYEFDSSAKFGKEGFVVAGTDTAAFLEEKLGAMGFTYREQAEFITYWLPKLAVNDYNRIEFLTGDVVDAMMPMEITPEPNNILRVYMIFAPCGPELAQTLAEQELPTLNREGFTVLEWGGSELVAR